MADLIEQTAPSTTANSLSYSAADDRYNYVWKTEKNWRGCRQLVLKFPDGTSNTQLADFEFK
jgi:hypothetical protein